jgi:hypothetical protein
MTLLNVNAIDDLAQSPMNRAWTEVASVSHRLPLLIRLVDAARAD